MNDRNLYRMMLLAAALFTAVQASSADAALPVTGAGMPDPTFGNGNGEITVAAGTRSMYPYGAALQADGKLVVSASIDGGQDIYSFAVARFLDNGALDPAFANGGIGVYPMSPNDGPGLNGAAIDANGRIFINGFTQPDSLYRCAVMTLQPNGQLDKTFGKNGLVEYQPTPGKSAQCNGSVVQPDGKIVVIGYQNLDVYQAFVIRLLPDGRFDNSFNGTGSVVLPSAGGFIPKGIVVAPDGSFFVGGTSSGKPRNGTVVKLRADGTIDSSFAKGGRFDSPTPGGASVEYYGIALQSDGKLVMPGLRGDGPYSAMVARVTDAGVPDPTFAGGGMLDFAISGYPGIARHVAIQKDGKYVIEARVVTANNIVRFAAARLMPDGTTDSTFGSNGSIVLSPFAAGSDYTSGMALGADGKIWISGDTTAANKVNVLAVARVLGDEVRTPIVEFYNSGLNHYFITADPNEASAIDNGAAGPGWMRTGQSWKSGGPSRVCRFYGSPDIDPATAKRKGPNGHFYTISADECAQVKEDAGWKFESYDFSGWKTQGDGQCAAGTIGVKRVYNNRFAVNDSNHRYATSDAIYNQMVAQGWSGEGTVFCAPQ